MRKEVQINKTRDIVFIALFAVLIAVCAWISIPSIVPFTMQTFAVYLTLNFLGGKRGTVSVCVYLLLGLIGVPVFSNFNAGPGALFGATGGYMIGWIFSGLVMWRLEKMLGNKIWVQAVSMVVGLVVCYIMGTAWFMFVYAHNTGPVGLWTALGWCVFPFIIPDMVKLGLALWLSQRLKKITKSL
ncbi:MAG: biotin transporter BioY [Oscillospiraceae bacterium]|nr:biotin transporter BioY [Oscillospiraceae bacterium]MBQ8807300.1 biotin transporter BioY [Bacteroidaceae bacterium]